MREIGCSDLWDLIIDRYCTKDEKEKLSKLTDNEYEELEGYYYDLIEEIKKVIK
jgi:hypothetical protein